MEQQRLDELNRQNEALRKRLQAQESLDNDALAKLAVKIVDELYARRVKFPKKSQLQNYRTASASYTSVVEIKIYLTYQMNRATNKLDADFGSALIENLPDNIEEARLFLGYFCRYGAQHAPRG